MTVIKKELNPYETLNVNPTSFFQKCKNDFI
jgi:hypothetical protein